MTRLATIVCLTIAAVAPRAAVAQDQRPLPDRVDEAIARAQTFLLTRPQYVSAGHWEWAESANRNGQGGGLTALSAYALLASGISPNDPRLRPAIAHLRGAEILGTYALGMRGQIWQYLPRSTENKAFVARDVRQLLQNIERNVAKPDAGLFDYGPNEHVRIDLSASQYGTLGLWACARLGAEVSTNYWKLIDNSWKALQHPERGGWSYDGTGEPSLAITTAGVATLYITLDQLAVAPRDEGNAQEAAIDRGLAYIVDRLPDLLADRLGPPHYTLYGVERIGVAGGHKLLGGVDWYAAGAEYLLATQRPDGEWRGAWGAEVDTSFALLFLARGREPVLMNKIRYLDQPTGSSTQPSEGRWNQRGRDVANAARFVGQELERSFNWQILDLDAAGLRDLHDAPIAFLAFRQPYAPRLAPEAMDKLRAYVESGGMVVVNNDSPPQSRPALAVAARQATTRPDALPMPASVARFFGDIFPNATIRRLPAESPILRNQQFRASNWNQPPVVYEATNGVRTLGLYLADDPGLAWQQAGPTPQRREPFELIADVYQYAIDKEHARVKGRSHYLDPTTQPTTRPAARSVRVARVKFEGNWDPEPGGWRRVAELAIREGTGVDVRPVAVDAGESLDGFAIAHLTGVGPLRLSPRGVAELRRFLDAGGTLLVDAAGGDATFDAAVRKLLPGVSNAFAPNTPSVAANDALFAGPTPIAWRYRTFAIATVGPRGTPLLRVAKVGKGGTAIYSPEDLSAGLVGQNVDGIRGYTPEVATDVVMRLVRRAAK